MVSSVMPEAPQVERGDVEAPLVVGADRDLAHVVEAARGEEAVDDDQRRAGPPPGAPIEAAIRSPSAPSKMWSSNWAG